ncbi:MAG: hypothetical protein H6740_05455 [Alphaproteobacteria bacterium]|nr:hypothetical protein [Alphaproteobacteria bacterium]
MRPSSPGGRASGASLVAPLRALLPGADNLRLQRLATGAWWALALGGGALVLGASALALKPPPAPSAPPPPPPVARALSGEEVRAAQLALRSLRDALSRAHEEMQTRGAVNRSWPDLYEVQENRYDADGDGPSEIYLELVPGGLPDNVLTDSRGGVLPYCNEEPTQETISGVDTDWHYCERTGRVFASAGFTEQATLNW